MRQFAYFRLRRIGLAGVLVAVLAVCGGAGSGQGSPGASENSGASQSPLAPSTETVVMPEYEFPQDFDSLPRAELQADVTQLNNPVLTAWTHWLQASETSLRVQLMTGKLECYDVHAEVTETADDVTIGVWTAMKPEIEACEDLGVEVTVEIDLEQPLAGRDVYQLRAADDSRLQPEVSLFDAPDATDWPTPPEEVYVYYQHAIESYPHQLTAFSYAEDTGDFTILGTDTQQMGKVIAQDPQAAGLTRAIQYRQVQFSAAQLRQVAGHLQQQVEASGGELFGVPVLDVSVPATSYGVVVSVPWVDQQLMHQVFAAYGRWIELELWPAALSETEALDAVGVSGYAAHEVKELSPADLDSLQNSTGEIAAIRAEPVSANATDATAARQLFGWQGSYRTDLWGYDICSDVGFSGYFIVDLNEPLGDRTVIGYW